MRVLILSQYYDPEPLPKAGELARELRDRGHEVEVITGFPNYPAGKLYDGYRLAPVRRATVDGIKVIRVFEYPYHGRNRFLRLVNYWSFVLFAPLAALFVHRADVMYVWHPPLTVGVAAWVISRLRRVPFVYDVQDIWPDAAVLSGMLREGLLWRAMLKLERFVYRRAAYLLVVTPAARQNLIGKGVPPEMVSVMNNWIDESLFADVDESERPRLRELHGWSDSFVAIFAGNLGMVQGLDTLVRAASMLTNDDRIRVVFVGDGTDRARLQTLTRELNIENRVEFIGRLPMTEMPRYMAAADALVVHLRRSDRARSIIPSKTLAYLAAGKPIVMAMEGAAADLVVEAGAGITLPGDEPEKLAEVLRQLAAMSDDDRRAFGRAGKDFLLRTMTRSHVISQYEEILRKVAGQK